MITPTEQETVQFVKDKLKTALTDLNITALDHASATGTTQRWMENWMSTLTAKPDDYKMSVFDSYGVVHFSPNDGASKPRYGWQAVLNGPLFESRKEFRSLRLAKLWVKQQMKCKCWPVTTGSEPDKIEPKVINMTIDFDYEGFLDKSFLVKNDSFR